MDPPEEEVKSLPCPWKVEEADEARYNFSDQKGVWQPKPEDILSVFEQLAKGGALPLKWTCPGRRAPESDTPNEIETEMEMEMAEDQSKEDYYDPEPSAFDFDDSLPDTNTKVTPWRAHAGTARTPKTEKRVARMDNIMDSLRKQQIQRAAEREARKSKGGTPSHVQQGRGRLIKFGSPLSKKTGSASISSLFGASSPSDPTDPVGTSSLVTASSSSTVTQSNMNSAPPNAPTPVSAPSPLGAPGSQLQKQDLKTDIDEGNKSDGQQKSEDKDFTNSRIEESVQPTSTIAAMVSTSSPTAAALPSSHPSFITISSDAQKRNTTENWLQGHGFQSSEQKFEASACQAVTSGDSVVTASSADGDVKTSSNPTLSLVTTATSSLFSSSTSAPQKTPSSNSTNGSVSKPSSSSYSNTWTGLAKTEESMATESSTVVSLASGNMAASVNETSGQMTSFFASSSTDTVAQSSAQTEWVKSSESISFPSTVNPSQASTMAESSLSKID